MKYSPLLNKKILVKYGSNEINHFTLKKIEPTDKKISGTQGKGQLFLCDVNWGIIYGPENANTMIYDEQTLDDLLNNGFSICPVPEFKELYFQIEKPLN